MRHPSLPEEQVIAVAPCAVPHHRSAGWVVVEDAPAAPAEQEQAPDAGASESAAPRRRQAKQKEADG